MNNAGMSPVAPSLLETSETLFDKVIGVNLEGTDAPDGASCDSHGPDRRRIDR